jgi:hypothetical protein
MGFLKSIVKLNLWLMGILLGLLVYPVIKGIGALSPALAKILQGVAKTGGEKGEEDEE